MRQAHHPQPVSSLQSPSTAEGMDSGARVSEPIMLRRRALYEAVAFAIALGTAASAFVPYRLAEAGLPAVPVNENSMYLSNGAYGTTGSFTNEGWIGIGYGSDSVDPLASGPGTISPTPGASSSYGGYGNAYGAYGDPFLGGPANLTNNAPDTLTNTGAVYVSEYGTLNNAGNVQNDGGLYNYGSVANTNTGTLSNAGYLFSDGDLTNTGTLDNLGDLVNYGALDSAGTLNNAGYLDNAGTLTNAESLTDASGNLSGAGIINNTSAYTLFNYGDLDNFGTLNNGDGTLANAGALINDGYLLNAAQVTDVDRSASGAGLINNAAYSYLTNYGLVDNFGTLSNNGSLLNSYDAIILNTAAASYEYGAGDTYELSGAGLIHNQIGGDLTNQGIIWNSGGYAVYDNGTSVAVKAGTIKNDGALTNGGFLINGGGAINNQAGGTLQNNGYLLNTYSNYSEPFREPGVINNAGTLSNAGYFGNYGGIVNNTGGSVIDNSGYLYNAPSYSAGLSSTTNAAGLAPSTNTDGGVINNDATLDNSGSLGNYGQINNQANGALSNSGQLYNEGEIRNSGLFEITETGAVTGGGDFIQETAGSAPMSTGAGPLNDGTVPETVVNGLLEAGTISIDAGRLSGDGGRIGLDGSFDLAAIASDFGPNMPSIGDAIGIGAGATVDAEGLADGQIGMLTFGSAVDFNGTLMVDMLGFDSGELDFYEVLDTITFGTGSKVIFDNLSFLTEPGTYEVSFIEAFDIQGFGNLGATFLGLPDWADADLLFVDNNASIRLRVTEGQQQIPLPTPLWLLLPGLGALGLARRRRGRSG
jgi:hypothetical protein